MVASEGRNMISNTSKNQRQEGNAGQILRVTATTKSQGGGTKLQPKIKPPK